MTTEMFGTPLGFRTYDEDQAKLAQMSAATQHQQALTRLNDTQASTMLRKQTNEDRLMEALGKTGQGPQGAAGGAAGLSLAEQMEAQLQGVVRQAGVYSAVGQTETAAKILQQAGSATSAVAAARAAEARQKGSALDTEIKKLRLVQERLTGVNGPQSHAEALLALQADPLMAGEEIPPALRQYNPAALKAFLSGSPAEIRKRELRLKIEDEARKQGDSESLRSLRKAQKEVAVKRADAYVARTERTAKAGPISVGTPSRGELDAVRGSLRQLGIKLETDVADAAAQTLAEQARKLWKNNYGYTPDMARARVIQEAVDRGELQVNSWSKDTYTPKPGSVSRPVPLPGSTDKLTKGQYYQAPSGAVAKWLGDRWEKVAGPAGVPQTTAPLGGGDDEEED